MGGPPGGGFRVARFKRLTGIPRLVLIEGFLGAGKTSLIGWYLEWLANCGLRAGVMPGEHRALCHSP